jgi:2-alkyl-3-oxoalkanoate reductase
MTSSRELRAALVGCGRIANYHIAALQALPDVRIVGVCDLDREAAEAMASRYGLTGTFTDVGAMMAEARPDVVHLLTPPDSHLALTELVAGRGAHLYVEKPFASDHRSAQRMAEIATRAGVTVCPGHNRLFDPPFVEACRRIDAGEIGRVLSVRAEQGFAYEKVAKAANIPWSYRYEWGVFDNLMPHALYLATHFLKEPGSPQVTTFDLGRIREAGVEEMRVLIPSPGAVGEVTLSMTAAPPQNRVEIVGTRGRLVVDYLAMSVTGFRLTGLPGPVGRFTAGFSSAWQSIGANTSLIAGIATGRIKQYMGLRALVAMLYDRIRQGQPSPVPVEQGVLNIRLMEEIKAACVGRLKRRQPVRRPAEIRSGPSVLVTGATGFLGGRLCERLAADGESVRATTRIASRVPDLGSVEWVTCDLRNESDLRAALQGIRTVYHCAAMAGGPGTLREYERANVDGTLELLRLAAESGVEQVVYVSSLSVYGATNHPYLDEDSIYERRAAERGVYTQTKLAADQAVRSFAQEHATPRVLLLRPGTIYGPGVKLPTGRFTLPSAPDRPLVAGGRGVPMPLTYVDNVIDAMRAAASSQAPTGRVFNVVDDALLDQGGVDRALREASNGKVRATFVPYPVVWAMMLGVDLVSLRKGRLGTARYRLSRTLANMRYRCERIRGELGWSPRVSLVEGLSRTMAAASERPYPW